MPHALYVLDSAASVMARKKSNDPSTQYRHFVLTLSVHPVTGAAFADPAESDKNTDVLSKQIEDSIRHLLGTVGTRDLGYAVVQLEKGSNSDKTENEASNGLHLQCYLESTRSIRLRTMWRHLPYARVRPRKGLRDTAREYCLPQKGSPFNDAIDSTVLATYEFGTWRPSRADEVSDDPYEAAIALVMKGFTAKDIARLFPKVWVRHGRGLAHLIHTLNDGEKLWNRDYQD